MFKNTIFLLGIYFISLMPAFSQGFKTKWITNRSGETNDYTVSIKTNSDFAYDYDVDIDEDGIMDFTNVTGDLKIEFDEPGEKVIEIFGHFPHLLYDNPIFPDKEINKLVEVIAWGNISWQRFDRMFRGCDSLVISAQDAPDLSGVDSLSYTFAGIQSFVGDLNNWDVREITKLNYTFCGNRGFNSPMNQWDVCNVTDMSYLFDEARIFNHDLSMWDVSKVQNMEGMFAGTRAFDSSISSWDVSNVENFTGMFSRSESFNQDLNTWDVSSGVDFSEMFQESAVFNGDISNWDLKNAETLSYMFAYAEAFNQDISDWDLSNVEDIYSMFVATQAFNQDIGNWDVTNVDDLSNMFAGAAEFNQDISDWDVSNIINFSRMFFNARSFNQDISSWNTSSARSVQSMFERATSFDQDLSQWNYEYIHFIFLKYFVANSGLSIENYDRLLIGMSDVGIENVRNFGHGLEYCESEEARDYLVNTLGWSDIGDEKNCIVSTENLSLSHKIYSASDGIHLTLESPHSEDIFLELFDAQGRPVKTYLHPRGEINNIFDASNLLSGLYFIRGLGTSTKLYIHRN